MKYSNDHDPIGRTYEPEIVDVEVPGFNFGQGRRWVRTYQVNIDAQYARLVAERPVASGMLVEDVSEEELAIVHMLVNKDPERLVEILDEDHEQWPMGLPPLKVYR